MWVDLEDYVSRPDKISVADEVGMHAVCKNRYAIPQGIREGLPNQLPEALDRLWLLQMTQQTVKEDALFHTGDNY